MSLHMNNKTNTKPIVVIGDVHGLTCWKDIVKVHKDSMFVFLGDYCDPYEDIKPKDLIKNFRSIIQFKKKRPDDVILLLGNHDMHYTSDDFVISTRYDERMVSIMKHISNDYHDLFLYSWQCGTMLFSHAGVNDQWFRENFGGQLNGEKSVAYQLNHPTNKQFAAMCQIGYRRGGDFDYGGIFWVDRSDTISNPLVGYHQFVGHSRVDNINHVTINDQTSITYCDCLYNKQYLVITDQSINACVLN